MRNDDLRTIQQNVLTYNSNLDIMQWGNKNDYPQQILRILQNSVTATECLHIYTNFLIGQGFVTEQFNQIEVNRQRLTLFNLLEAMAKDFATFGGFAVLVKYNALLQIRELYPIPFEQIRIADRDDNYNYHHIALHEDWGKEYQRLKRFDAEDIKRFPFFDNSKERLKAEILQAGGVKNYKGQIFYYSNLGKKEYPQPIYTPAMKDMHTEDTIATINNRNAYNRFMPSGMLIQVLNNNGIDEYEAEELNQQFQDNFLKAQGPDNLGKIMAMTVKDKEDIPQFISMQTNNYAEDYKATSENVKKSIRQSFHLPPILCSEAINTGFDTSAMQSAFIYYNQQTQKDRTILEQSLQQLLNNPHLKINPLQWEAQPLL